MIGERVCRTRSCILLIGPRSSFSFALGDDVFQRPLTDHRIQNLADDLRQQRVQLKRARILLHLRQERAPTATGATGDLSLPVSSRVPAPTEIRSASGARSES